MGERFYYIEMQCYWQGKVNSTHISQQFSISRTQGQKYLANYQALHPNNLKYDTAKKGFIPRSSFVPKYISGQVSEYLNWLDNAQVYPVKRSQNLTTNTSLSPPERQVSPTVIRSLVQAIQNKQRIEVDYVSLSNPNQEGRIIQPHVFVRTGLRWHLRAYDESRSQFRDFVLSRFRGQPEILGKASHTAASDKAWNTNINLVLIPDSRFSPAQKQVIEGEYNMQNGQLTITTRAALAHYLLQEMQVNLKFHDEYPEAQQLVLANKQQIKQWLFNA